MDTPYPSLLIIFEVPLHVETLSIFPYLEIEKKQDWKIISVALENVGYTSIFCANGGMEECFKVKEVSATCCMCCFPFGLPPPKYSEEIILLTITLDCEM